MKSLIVAALVAAGGGGSYWFWQQQQSGEVELGGYVPADTALYIGGQTSPAIVSQLEHLYAQPDMGTDIEMLASEIEQGGDYPALNRFAASLMRDLFAPGTNIQALYSRLGLVISGPQQLFVDGLVPVLHISAEKSATFTQFWAQHGRSAGLPVFENELDGSPYTRIQLSPPEETNRIDLIVAQTGEMAVLTFAAPFDSDNELAQRLRLKQPEENLLQSGTLGQIAQRYGFTKEFSFLLDIEAIAKAVLGVDQTRMAKDLEALFALTQEPAPAATLTQVCREEYASIAGWVPRIVAGYTSIQTEPGVSISSRSVLEVKSGEVLNQLNLLNGHVPNHVADANQQLFGLGVGLDMDQLMPVTVQLWNQFTQQTFACAELRQMQQQAASNNPAMLGLFTGMAQGIKGVGLSLYDFTYGNAIQPIKSLDLLLSVATQNPALLASMAAGSPAAAFGQIPTDGSTASVDLSEIQPGLSAEVGLKGQHLTFAMGAKGRAAANALASEALEPNGLLAMSLNYPAFGRLVEAFPLDAIEPLITDSETSVCLERARVVELLRQQPIKAAYRMGFSPQGFDSTVDLDIDAQEEPGLINPVGSFTLYDQTWDCPQGVMVGVEEIRADGTGTYEESDESGACSTYAYDYRWSQSGNRLSFDITSSRGRSDCVGDWEEYGTFAASCRLIPSAEGFGCIYEDDESDGLFAYKRR